MSASGPTSGIHVPIVTQRDLNEFHAIHFPTSQPAAPVLQDPVAGTTNAEETGEEDGLGYYSDGVKRTLTDEQIEMFRHSEIQALLKDRRLRREADADAEAKSNNTVELKELGKCTGQNLEEEEEAERRDLDHDARPNKKRQKAGSKKSNEQAVSQNRRARELDDVRTDVFDLDY